MQAQRWQDNQSSSSVRTQLVLTLDSAEQQQAAVAVIAAMYKVPEALSQLEHHQLKHAAVIADRLQAGAVTEQAVVMLKAAADAEPGLTAEALQQLASLYPWPSCLLPVLGPAIAGSSWCRRCAVVMSNIQQDLDSNTMKQLLLSVFQDLEAAWADSQLHDLLLQLPVPAMVMLLSCDELRVVSEDNVMHVVQQYCIKHRGISYESCGQLIRCQHLSEPLLCGLASCSDVDVPKVLHLYTRQLKRLASMRRAAQHAETEPWADLVTKHISSAPRSWLLGTRNLQPPSSIQATWRWPLAKLKVAVQDCSERHVNVLVDSTPSTMVSPLFGGMSWHMSMRAIWVRTEEGVAIAISVEPRGALAGTFHVIDFHVIGPAGSKGGKSTRKLHEVSSYVWRSLFQIGVMVGGWEEHKWVARGLPVSGDIEFKLIINAVH